MMGSNSDCSESINFLDTNNALSGKTEGRRGVQVLVVKDK